MPDTAQPRQRSHIKYFPEMEQGSEEWLAARCGILTASEMKLIITPTLKTANNDKERSHLYELAAQRINKYVEPHYISDDMLRGHDDEILARQLYSEKFAPVQECGFITNDQWGFTIGYSPDALVGDDGLIECKSRRQKYQFETIVSGVMPDDYKIQVQTGFLVSGRKWCDFISYSGGMPMVTIRVTPDPVVQDAIIAAATAFEMRLEKRLMEYREILKSNARLTPTERRVQEEMTL
jgi:predicted phage-related endonuclease